MFLGYQPLIVHYSLLVFLALLLKFLFLCACQISIYKQDCIINYILNIAKQFPAKATYSSITPLR